MDEPGRKRGHVDDRREAEHAIPDDLERPALRRIDPGIAPRDRRVFRDARRILDPDDHVGVDRVNPRDFGVRQPEVVGVEEHRDFAGLRDARAPRDADV